jgi:hypothetical protein
MTTPFDMLGSVSPGKETWRIKVRVLRLWTASSFMKPDQPNSLEMVLIDEKVSNFHVKVIVFIFVSFFILKLVFFGCLLLIQGIKIHASVRRQLLYLFSSKIAEGNVYKMSYFSVVRESGCIGLLHILIN